MKQLAAPIRVAVESLPHSHFRVRATATAPRYLAWKPTSQTSFEQQLLAARGIRSAGVPGELQKEFDEEIAAMRESLGSSADTPMERAEESIANSSAALGLWKYFAIPWRRRGDVVFHLNPADDILGVPQVTAVHVDDFIVGACDQTALDAARIVQLSRKVDRLQTAVLMLGLVLLLALTW